MPLATSYPDPGQTMPPKPKTERPPSDDTQKGEVDPDTIYHPDNTI